MGAAFISIFNLMAYCTRVSGITSMVLANKLSLVIPVICSLILFHEHAGIFKIAGIVLAFPAVYLTTRTGGEKGAPANLFWPALLFFVSGGLDTLVNYIQATYLNTHEAQAAATIICFATAGTSGLVLLAVKMAGGKMKLELRNVVAGICLGIPNFFSIFFLVKALNSNLFESSATIPLLNIGILLASSVTAILFFREAAGKWRIMGLALALIAILLIALGD
jgi:drug/metabolite transporter (DMT)-like permease